jgi:hypothetical protein
MMSKLLELGYHDTEWNLWGQSLKGRSVLRNNAIVNANLSPQFSPGGKNRNPCGSTGHPLAPLSLREARKKKKKKKRKARGEPCASLSLSSLSRLFACTRVPQSFERFG